MDPINFGYLALAGCILNKNWSSKRAFKAGGLTIDSDDKVLEIHKTNKMNYDNIILMHTEDEVREMVRLHDEEGLNYVKVGALYEISDCSVIRLMRHYGLWKPGKPGPKKRKAI